MDFPVDWITLIPDFYAAPRQISIYLKGPQHYCHNQIDLVFIISIGFEKELG